MCVFVIILVIYKVVVVIILVYNSMSICLYPHLKASSCLRNKFLYLTNYLFMGHQLKMGTIMLFAESNRGDVSADFSIVPELEDEDEDVEAGDVEAPADEAGDVVGVVEVEELAEEQVVGR